MTEVIYILISEHSEDYGDGKTTWTIIVCNSTQYSIILWSLN